MNSFLTTPAGDLSRGLVILWLVSFAIFSAILPRDATYDVAHYHLHNGWAWWEGRLSRDAAPADMHSFLNPLWQIPIWWMVDTLPGRMVAFILGLAQAAIFPVLYAVVRRTLVLTERAPALSLVLALTIAGLCCKVMFGQLSSVRNDWVGALAFLGALLALLPRSGGLPPLGRLAWASLALGLATGMKATNVVHVAAFAVIVPLALSDWTYRLKAVAACAAAGLAGMLLSAGGWSLHLYSEFGNPLFPMLNSWFDAPLGPGEPFRDLRYVPASFSEALWRPFAGLTGDDVSNDFNFFDLRLALLMFMAPLLAIVSRAPFHRALAIGALVALILWTAVFSIPRYAIGLWMIAPLVAVLAFTSLQPNRLNRPIRNGTALAALGLLTVTTHPGYDRRVAWSGLTDPYVSADISDPTQYDDSLILFAGQLPAAFLAPSFPDSATFSHAVPAVWSRPALAPYRAQVLDPLLDTHPAVYAVIVDHADHLNITAFALHRDHGLTVDVAACTPIPTSFDTPVLGWVSCPVRSKTEVAP